jgi:hypothetical protein
MATKRKYFVENGQRYGRLVAQIETRVQKDPSHRYHICLCDCGNTVTVRDDFLCKGVTQSCGCLWTDTLKQYQNKNSKKSSLPVGFTSGRLTITEDLGVIQIGSKKDHCYKCLCSCGEEIIVRQYLLKKGQQSCGCLKSELLSKSIKEKSKEKRVFPDYLLDLLIYDEEKKGVLQKNYIYEDKLHFKCSKCGCIVEKKITDVIRLNAEKETPIVLCLECSNHRSAFEQEIFNYIKYLLPETYMETNKWGLIRDEHKLYEVDIYIPDKKVAIECNGDYFHSEQKGKGEKFHQYKFELAEKLGIHLIQIYQSMWRDNTERIKNYLKDMFCETERVFARKCTIIEPTKDMVRSFYDINHLQGYTTSCNINFALLYEGEIVAMMSFCKTGLHNPKEREEDYYELSRYAVKSGCTVIGGPSKLLHYFEILFHPRKILSYSDNNFFTGSMYAKLGFVLEGKTRPRYHWYLKDQTVRTREKCQLKVLSKLYPNEYEESLLQDGNKETYIMTSLGAVKVWHSGTKRWIKRYV